MFGSQCVVRDPAARGTVTPQLPTGRSTIESCGERPRSGDRICEGTKFPYLVENQTLSARLAFTDANTAVHHHEKNVSFPQRITFAGPTQNDTWITAKNWAYATKGRMEKLTEESQRERVHDGIGFYEPKEKFAASETELDDVITERPINRRPASPAYKRWR